MDGSCQSTSLTSSHGQDAAASWPPKRPAGRTKFKETRHPVYRGVRRRGLAGRWVCEVRVPGAGCKRGQRVWLGTHLSAEAAGRAHDAAMLMLRGAAPGARILNFPDSEWLLDVPLACPGGLPSVRRAAAAAVAGFQRREPASNGAAVPDLDEAAASWAASRLLPRGADNGGMPLLLSLDFEVPDAAGMFELDDICGETDLDMYYAELAEGLLMEPPPDAGPAGWQSGDGRVADDDDLWSCY